MNAVRGIIVGLALTALATVAVVLIVKALS